MTVKNGSFCVVEELHFFRQKPVSMFTSSACTENEEFDSKYMLINLDELKKHWKKLLGFISKI